MWLWKRYKGTNFAFDKSKLIKKGSNVNRQSRFN